MHLHSTQVQHGLLFFFIICDILFIEVHKGQFWWTLVNEG
jgi:hypothetical protein